VAVDPGSHPNFFRWFDAIEARAAVHRAYAQGKEIRARMDQASSAGAMIDLYNTADNLARLSGATARAV
jgi:hypothetical protein